ncbi:UDP-glycosyltransferase TURAN {ECO:0000303/PubMed:25919390} [Serendipita indica DSM 11827]|uniref:Chitobiosyldiphosphodolichol beta-mannosyltransferase n=1 Tax=Serendipita indica (strain DSM 11827) TaxID=1109443 RepID=G4TPP4_SERID|nr:UDP-glycosyltransferase TURAN {ECO:0000303/PubMed:25919390} [Serendipita indica DSM 11827]CCA73277.1 related to ALG1-beta-mannosyltransferase [Serendipita indica DSM 11827]
MNYDPALGWDVALGLQLFLAALFLLFVFKLIRTGKRDHRRLHYGSVAILVLGDIGRSPRMMYHAQSFASHRVQTYIVAYKGSKPIPSLLSMSHVEFLYIPEPPRWISKLPRRLFILLAPIKVAYQIWGLLNALVLQIPEPPVHILVQNPPTIPTLAVAWLVARIRGSRVIIDWHNLGYTILALRLGEKSRLVSLAKKFEQVFGRSAYAHLFVTNAMKEHLVKEWDLQGKKIVLHDRPPSYFHQCSPSEIHDLFVRLVPLLTVEGSWFPSYKLPSTTPFTEIVKSPRYYGGDTSLLEPRTSPNLRHERPALLITSTSWTPDEDFSILIEALKRYERAARTHNAKQPAKPLPKVLMCITGQGPLRAKYMAEIQDLIITEKWEWVRCQSLWLEPEDYPRLLGSCDLGISLHSSSSALDLPMKIVDMFGCHLPVCALNFACLGELVTDGQNGLVFEDADGLATHLQTLLSGFPNSEQLDRLRANLGPQVSSPSRRISKGWKTWDQNWDENFKPLVIPELSQQSEEWLEAFVNKRRSATASSPSL